MRKLIIQRSFMESCLLFVFRFDILSSMLLDLANACCCFLFRFAFVIMCLIANAFKARSCLRMHAIESPLS